MISKVEARNSVDMKPPPPRALILYSMSLPPIIRIHCMSDITQKSIMEVEEACLRLQISKHFPDT